MASTKKRKRVLKPALKTLKKKLDKVFSEYIRKRDKYICFTCGKKMTLKTSQNGHFVPRNYLATRFDEDNCHCQCVGCNVFKKGNLNIYAEKLGQLTIEILNAKSKEKVKFTRSDYEELIKEYEERICS